MHRRGRSETLRAQYINSKDVRFGSYLIKDLFIVPTNIKKMMGYLYLIMVGRVTVGTWNVGGRIPLEDLEIDEWLHMKEPADMYVLG